LNAALQQNVEPEVIERRAYALWQERGCPIGSDQDDWYRAERELNGQEEPEKKQPSRAETAEREPQSEAAAATAAGRR
jgi:hypothetical protein